MPDNLDLSHLHTYRPALHITEIATGTEIQLQKAADIADGAESQDLAIK